MSSRKIRVAVLCGGRSAEHEASLLSARNVVAGLDTNKYEVSLIGISRENRWHLLDPQRWLLNPDNPKKISLALPEHGAELTPLAPQATGTTSSLPFQFDVVFPVLHGPYGEDGTVQGLLKLAGIPFVGPSVLGSAVSMDKDVMKRLLRDAQIPIGRFEVVTNHSFSSFNEEEVIKKLGLPLFVKPANLGSSVGISKVKTKEELRPAMEEALRYDTKILIEEFIKGREIECSVLGNEAPRASLPGELIPQHEFYSYEAKYIDEKGAQYKIPAQLPPEIVREIQEVAIRTYQTLCCEGMGRVDFFLTDENKLYVNEINTIPGFTNISMYPKLWEVSGLPYSELLDELIRLALSRGESERRLRVSA